MKRSAQRRGVALPILCLAIIACGNADQHGKASDPNTPAVVTAPPPVLPGDTAKKPAPQAVTEDEARMTVARNYALVGAGLAMADARLLVTGYADDARFTTPNGTFTGKTAIVGEYRGFGGSVKEFRRQSRMLKVIDSSVVDSGVYMIIRKRAPADSTIEEGPYAAEWKIQAAPMDWVMTRDHLYPSKAVKPKKR